MLQKITYLSTWGFANFASFSIFKRKKIQTHYAHWQKVVAKYVALFSLFWPVICTKLHTYIISVDLKKDEMFSYMSP